MVKITVGEKTKKLIADTCKHLFYKKGYACTTVKDIADEADVARGSIAYHFGNKLCMGLAVRSEFEREVFDYTCVLLLSCGIDHKTRVVVGLLHYWKLLYEDDNIRRFLVDIATDSFTNEEKINEVKKRCLFLANEHGVSNIDDKNLNLIAAALVGVERELLYAIAKNSDVYTYEEIAVFFSEMHFELIGIPKESYRSAISMGKAIFPIVPYDHGFYRFFEFDDKYLKPAEIKLPTLA